MSSTVDVVTVALVPVQTIVSEAIIAVLIALLGGHVGGHVGGNYNIYLQKNVLFIVIATLFTLVLTLCVCNLLLSLNKLQKVIGSTSLITQAGITTIAQMKSLRVEFETHKTDQENIDETSSTLDRILKSTTA